LKLGRTEIWLWHMGRKVAHLALWLLPSVLFTSPTGVAAKYFNEYLSMCLSVHEDISRTTCTIFTNFFVHIAYVHGSVILRHVDDRPHRLSVGRG